jgi:hypothetical protein
MTTWINQLTFIIDLTAFAFLIALTYELFRLKGGLHGLLGIVTLGIYSYFWGWRNMGVTEVKKLTVRWTIAIAAQIALRVAEAFVGRGNALG